MSILVWVRDKLFGKPNKVETPVNPQITDAVTQSAPVVSAAATGSLAATATAAAASTKKKKETSTNRRPLKTKR